MYLSRNKGELSEEAKNSNEKYHFKPMNSIRGREPMIPYRKYGKHVPSTTKSLQKAKIIYSYRRRY